MRFEFTYTPEDLAEPAKAAVQGSVYRRGIIGWIFFIAMAIVMFILMQDQPVSAPASSVPIDGARQTSWIRITVYAAAFLLILGYIWFILIPQVRGASLRSQWKKNQNLQVVQKLDIDESRVTLANPLAATSWGWSAFDGWAETPAALLLRLREPGPMYVVIPKRVAGEQELKTLRQVLATNAGSETSGFPVLPAQ